MPDDDLDTASDRPAPPAPAARRSWRGNLIALVALALLIGLAWTLVQPDPPADMRARAGGARPAGGAAARGAPPSTVAVASARSMDLPVVLQALGTVTPSVSVTVRPQVSGILQQVLFTEGDMVKKGQLLAIVDPRPFEIALQQATGARQRDEAQLQNARLTLERFRTLLQQDSIARQEVDTQAALVRQLEGTLTVDRSAEASARLNLAYSRITAPTGGRIGLRSVDAGNYVSAGDATGIAVITQLAPIDVEFAVPQDRVPEVQSRVAEGARLAVRALDRTRRQVLAQGTFLTLDNQVDVQTGTVRAKARFANADGALFPNQFVNVELLLRTDASAVVVPVAAVRNGAQGDFVYVVGDDRTVSVRPVTRGGATDAWVAIASGLQPGERVVTEGGDRLRDGARVQLPDDAAGGNAGGGRGAAPSRRGASAPAGASMGAPGRAAASTAASAPR